MRINKPKIIFDACALVSFLKPQPNEPGLKLLESYFGKFAMSTISIAEVIDVLMRKDVKRDTALDVVKFSIKESFMLKPDLEIAFLAGEIRSKYAKPPYELSMADCFCLAHANMLGLPVITADKTWDKIAKHVGVKIIQYK